MNKVEIKKFKLGDVSNNIQTGPFGSQLHQSDYTEDGTPVIMPKDFANGIISIDSIARVSEEHVNRLKQHKVKAGDIIYSRRGDVGRCALITSYNDGWLCGTGCIKVELNRRLADPSYTYYRLYNQDTFNWVQQHAVGAIMPNINTSIVSEIPIKLPPLPVQHKIAAVLTALDDKIALNKRINDKLEAMAKRLYDYWFVQFDFPDENGRPYKSSGGKMIWNETLKREIPEGWEVCEIGERISLERGISYSTANLHGDGIPMINLGSFAIGGGYKNGSLKTYNGTYSDDKIIAPYDLLVCLTQQTSIDFSKDVIGCSMIVPDIFKSDIVISQDLAKVVCCGELKYYLHQLFKTFHFHKYITGFVSGSNIMHLDASGILRHKTAIPPKSILQKYRNISQSIFAKTSKASAEISSLTALRDRLLPLLMNGQVEVK